MNMEESTIDLKDLLRRCLERWKLVLVCMLVGAVVLNFVGVYKERTAPAAEETDSTAEDAPAEEAPAEEPQPLTLEECRDALTKQEQAEVENVFSVYCAYREQYLNYADYYNTSSYMKIDPQNVPSALLEYYVDDHYSVEYPVLAKRDTRDVIVQQYAEKVTNTDAQVQMAKALGLKENDADLGRYVSAWNGGNGVLYIKIVAANEKDRDTLVQAAEQLVENATSGIQNVFGEFDIQQNTRNLYSCQDSDVQNNQNSIRNELLSARSRMDGLNGSLSEAQNNYYAALVSDLKENDKEAE